MEKYVAIYGNCWKINFHFCRQINWLNFNTSFSLPSPKLVFKDWGPYLTISPNMLCRTCQNRKLIFLNHFQVNKVLSLHDTCKDYKIYIVHFYILKKCFLSWLFVASLMTIAWKRKLLALTWLTSAKVGQ